MVSCLNFVVLFFPVGLVHRNLSTRDTGASVSSSAAISPPVKIKGMVMCEEACRASSWGRGLHERGRRVVLGILLEERSTDRSRREVC